VRYRNIRLRCEAASLFHNIRSANAMSVIEIGADATRAAVSGLLLMLWTAPTLRHRSAIGWLR